jgi:small-conductance mechanosensitive channel
MTVIATAFYETHWFTAVVYIVVAVIIARVVDFILARRDRAMAKLLGKKPDHADRTRYIMIRRLVFVGILFIGIGIALLKIPMVSTLARAMLASAAIIAGVIGIAARAPIANLVSGVMIAFSQPVRLNDYISVDGEFGTVEQISLIYTYIRSADGRRVVIPNEAFAMKAVHNYSMGSPGSMVTVDLALPLDADVERVADAMLEVGESLAPAPAGKQDSVEVADVSGGSVRLRLHAWAADPLRRRELASDLRAALLRRLIGDGLLGKETADGGD